jgi:hypothetical protein
MMNKINIAPIVLAVALGVQLSPAAASAYTGSAHRPFSFYAVENMSASARAAAVGDFVAQELPVGTLVSEAVGRLRQAHANCGRLEAAAPIRCEFSGFGGASAGGFSEVTWTVTLSQNDQGLLTGTAIDRSQYGFGGN